MTPRNEKKIGYREVAKTVRGWIIQGRYPAESTLPTRMEIEEFFGVSRVTIQRAMNLLQEDGFIRMAGRRATYVESLPPHIFKYALVFKQRPSEQHILWSRFLQLLDSQSNIISSTSKKTIQIFYGIDDKEKDSKSYNDLLSGIDNQRFAGVIFAGNIGTDVHRDAAKRAGVPSIVIPSPSGVSLDNQGFAQRSVEYLSQQGCRTVALLTNAYQKDTVNAISMELEKVGVKTQRYWNQQVDLHTPYCATNLIELMMNNKQSERPDGLIITDDNLVEPALNGIYAAGINLKTELKVVAHCNFPRSMDSTGLITWLGYDIQQVLFSTLSAVDKKRNGEKIEPILIPALFEHELNRQQELKTNSFQTLVPEPMTV